MHRSRKAFQVPRSAVQPVCSANATVPNTRKTPQLNTTVAASALPCFEVQLALSHAVVRSCSLFTFVNLWRFRTSSDDQGHGVFGMLILLLAVGFSATDVFRHLLVQYKSDVVTVLEFGLPNPFNGNEFGFTNLQAADACYVTNLIFAGSAMVTVEQTYLGCETTLLATRFKID